MRFPLLIALALLACCTAACYAARAAPRPYSGCGVLATHPAIGAQLAPLAVYADPGLQRIAELALTTLPRLAGDQQEPLLAVSATKGNWVRIAYDDAGREGWIEPPRSWEYRTWAEFLAGRAVRVLPGMKKVLYVVKVEREGETEKGTLTRDQVVRIIQVEDDWARLKTPSGWFRWRDGDGRLTVSP